ncbi:MAG: hypothetical protein BGO98_31040 [Myxococcales bacterium 68-20]|nr:hypothetical protein [Myxococcales bacterium]OJY18204.1 MAG: hypothetical protein BGO98_31040 [Myxococcales bacterium 68-20]
MARAVADRALRDGHLPSFITAGRPIRSGAPAPDVQKLAGHLHLHVTQRYAHSSEASQEAAMTAFSVRMMEASGRGSSVETEPMNAVPRKRSISRKGRKSGRSRVAGE